MSTETAKVKSRLASLASSLDDLELLLQPLLSQTLPESVMALEPIQQAKLQTVLPYLVYDLIFIYLKARGIDPKSHSVVSELDRVKQYFEKIANAENSGTSRSLSTKIDKDAAGRFIKNAILQASKQPAKDETAIPAAPPLSVPLKVTQKMLARAQYEREIKQANQASSDEEELQVITDGDKDDDKEHANIDKPAVGDGQSSHIDRVADQDRRTQGSYRHRRPIIDPFAGYGDNSSPSSKKPKLGTDEQESHSSIDTTSVNASSSESLSTKHQKGKKTKKSKRLKSTPILG
ncbi:hypothetical protein AX17_000123 [Amanita inopinata Kibby_2008]|nr:hypothetical protein AX17_000123 [Amanita inopinata Kibby_2008]